MVLFRPQKGARFLRIENLKNRSATGIAGRCDWAERHKRRLPLFLQSLRNGAGHPRTEATPQISPSYNAEKPSPIRTRPVLRTRFRRLRTPLYIPWALHRSYPERLLALPGATQTLCMVRSLSSGRAKEHPRIVLFHIGTPPFFRDGFPPDFRAFSRLWAVFVGRVVSQPYPLGTSDTGATIGSTVSGSHIVIVGPVGSSARS